MQDATNGMRMGEIAQKYGVSRQTIYNKLKKANARIVKQPPAKPTADLRKYNNVRYDPETGYAITTARNGNTQIIGRIGDEKVTEFVKYHMEMMVMRQGCDKRNVPELYNRFKNYLIYCAEHGIVPNNMNAYFAIGISRQDVSAWKNGVLGTPEHKAFAETLTSFFASVHEQGATDGVLNPISAMFWQKAHDGMIEASKLEVVREDPLGDKRSAEDIAKAYSEVELPD